MLIVSLSLIVFSVLFVWLGFGLLVACVRVVYVIGHTCGFPDHEVVNGALLHHGSMCLQPRASDVYVRLRPLLANVIRQLLRCFVVF